MLSLFRIPIFRRLYTAHVIHILGNEFSFIAVVGLLHDLSGTGLSFAAGTVFRLMPYVIASAFSGTVIEKLDKRLVMIAVNLIRGILVSMYFWVTNPSMLWNAFLLLILMNIFSAFFNPAMQVVVVENVDSEKRLAANSLMQGTNAFLIIVGQGIAAFLVSYFSYRFNFLLDAGCYFLSLLFLLRLPPLTSERKENGDSFAFRLKEGFVYLWRTPRIRQILYLQMAERVVGCYYILLMYYVLEERGWALYVFGILDIPLGIGGALAGLVMGRWAARLSWLQRGKLLGLLLMAAGLSVLMMFELKPFVFLVISSFLLAFASFSLMILSVTRLQQLCEPDFMARLFSAREMVTMGVYSFSCVVIGYGVEQAGSSFLAAGLAVWGIAAGIAWLFLYNRKE